VTDIDPKFSRLYRDGATEEPPASLDALILAAAREHVPTPQRRARPWWSRWMVPTSVMATLVLGVSITLLLEREHPEIADGTIVRQIPSQPESAAPARVTETAKAQTAVSGGSDVAAKKEAGGVAVTVQDAASQSARSAADAVTAFPAENRAKTAGATMMRESVGAGDGASDKVGAAVPAAPAAATSLVPLRQQAALRSPEAWLDEIRRLKREGREADAAAQLIEFRKAYPAYTVPATLLQ
jgi:hypothetical protein